MGEGEREPYKPHPVSLGYVLMLSFVQCSFFMLLGMLLSLLFASPTLVPWWLVFRAVYTCEVLSLLTHWLGHKRLNVPILRQWYEAHTVGHHLQDYPPSKFLSPAYEPAKQDNSWGYLPGFLLTPFLIGSPLHVVPFLVAYGSSYAMLLVADTIHMALHVRGHPWERFEWFSALRSLHYHHHSGDMKRNYAIGDFFLDILLLGFKH